MKFLLVLFVLSFSDTDTQTMAGVNTWVGGQHLVEREGGGDGEEFWCAGLAGGVVESSKDKDKLFIRKRFAVITGCIDQVFHCSLLCRIHTSRHTPGLRQLKLNAVVSR